LSITAIAFTTAVLESSRVFLQVTECVPPQSSAIRFRGVASEVRAGFREPLRKPSACWNCVPVGLVSTGVAPPPPPPKRPDWDTTWTTTIRAIRPRIPNPT